MQKLQGVNKCFLKQSSVTIDFSAWQFKQKVGVGLTESGVGSGLKYKISFIQPTGWFWELPTKEKMWVWGLGVHEAMDS